MWKVTLELLNRNRIVTKNLLLGDFTKMIFSPVNSKKNGVKYLKIVSVFYFKLHDIYQVDDMMIQLIHLKLTKNLLIIQWMTYHILKLLEMKF